MNILILGPQGSGKGTQAELLSQKFDLLYLEMGSLLRDLAKKDAEIDKLINKEGKLVPDEKTADIFTNFLKLNPLENKKGLILDGFPRTPKQYEFVKDYLAKAGQKLDWTIFLEISEEISVKRLSARRICENCGKTYNLLTNPPKNEICDDCGGKLMQRKDDKEDAIRERLSIYRERTQPLIEILEKEGILIRVNGERPIETIFQDICTQLQQKTKKK